MFFRKKKKSYGHTGQVSSNYVPKYVHVSYLNTPPLASSSDVDCIFLSSYMQPMPSQQTTPSWGATPAPPPMSHYGGAGLQPPVYHADAGAAYPPTPALPSRPAPALPPAGPYAHESCGPSLGSSHSAAYHYPPPAHGHHHHPPALGSSHSAAYTYQQPA